MTPEEIRAVLSRIDGIWPPRQAPTQEERREWVVFLKTLEGPLCLEALDEMRRDCRWRPSMAELRDHYDEAALRPIGTMLALPSAKTAAPHSDYGLTYGHNREQWVYCWKCDMAISLEQQEVAYWDELRGLRHEECPRKGSAPTIPTHLRLAREDCWRRNRIDG